MSLRARLASWLVFFVVTAWAAAPVQAQEYDEATIAEVNAHFATGARLYYDGKYDEAIAEFEAAHAKIPNAIFLYNISLAQAKNGDTAGSLRTAEQAEELGGLGPNEQVQNQARVVALRRIAPAETASAEIAARPRVEPLLNLSPIGWIGSGVFVAGVLGFAGVGVIDRNLSADVDDLKAAAAAGDTNSYERIKDDIRPRQRMGRAVFVVSSVLVVGGAGLVVYDLFFRRSEGGVAVVPMMTSPGLSVIARF